MWVRRGVRVRPSLVGDDRERGRRAGMENLPAIVGWAAALGARAAELDVEAERLTLLAERLRAALPSAVSELVVHGDPASSLPGLVSFSVLYVEGETLLLGLDEKGIAVHSGSSCTSSTQEPSHVLAAIGALTQGSIRVSMGTIFSMPLVRSANLLRDLKELGERWGVERIATVLSDGAEPLARAGRPARIALLFGNEAQGLDEKLVGACDRRVTIPMKLGTDSLNVSIAAALFLYHFTQERQPGGAKSG